MKMGLECTDPKTYPSRANSHKYTSVISGSVYVYPYIGKLLQLTADSYLSVSKHKLLTIDMPCL